MRGLFLSVLCFFFSYCAKLPTESTLVISASLQRSGATYSAGGPPSTTSRALLCPAELSPLNM